MAFSYMTEPGYIARMIAAENISFLTRTIVMFYLSLLVYGAITMISEWETGAAVCIKEDPLYIYIPDLHVHLHPDLCSCTG